ncbi:MAG: hypothetical protein IJO71_09150 [Microbacterium sp.]|uniref:hypothetical protein n=1 Tax=Microbacterium sp. TaxID=51671 RepID=UPI0025E4E9BD|nr:hypothetical protein [Microbacterium sp.]MBQ9917352.1 hypothetical protein [Microbacterium sp.]
MPDTTKFRNDLRDKLRQIERTTTATVRVDRADVDRAAVRESIKRQMADFRGLSLESQIEVLVDRAKVDREKVRASIQAQLREFGDLRVNLDPRISEKGKETFNHEIDKLIRHNSGKKVDLAVNAHALAASATISRVARPRFVELIVQVNKGSMAKALTTLAALSGARLTFKWIDDLLDRVRDLDKNLPTILGWTTGITSLVAALAGSVSGLVGIGQGLFSILPAFLVIPGLVQNAIGSAAVLIVALKNTKKELAELGPGFTALGNTINTTFWARARQPLLDLINGLMPQMQNAFRELATGVGDFTGALAKAFSNELGNGRFEAIFANVAEGWRILATGADGFAGAITSLSQIAARYTPRLASWFVRQANTFDNWLNSISNDGRLDAWMEQAIDSMYDLWDAVTGVAGVFTGLWRAADQAGSGGLKGFAEMMQEWKRITNGPAFQRGLTAVFRGSYSAMEAFGGAVKAIGDLIADWPDQIERFIAASGNFLGGLIEGVFQALNSPQFAAGLDGLSSGLGRSLEGLLPSLQPIADTFGDFLGLLGDLAANLLPTAAGVLADLMPSIENVISAIRDSGVLEKLATAVSDVSSRLGPVVEGLVSAFSPALISALEAFADAAGPLGESIAQLAEMAIPLGDGLSAFWDGWSNVVSTISAGTQDWSWLWNDDAMNKLIDKAIESQDWFSSALQWARDFDAGFQETLTNIDRWLNEAKANISTFFSEVGQVAIDTFNNITTWVTDPLVRMTGLIMGILTGFQTGNWDPFWAQLAGNTGAQGEATGIAGMEGLARGTRGGQGAVSASVQGVVDNGILAVVRNVGGALFNVGANLIQGLVAGIRSVASSVASAAVSVVSGAVNAAKSFLNINSPSRVTRDVLGKPWGEGVAVGILSQRRSIVNAATSAIDPDGIPVPSAGRGAGGGGNQYQITMPLLPGETPQEQRDNLVRELQLVP